MGAAKCATTSFYNYLRQHPDIFMPENKEPTFHGFCRDLQFTSKRGMDDPKAYLALFQPAKSEHRIGEASVAYLRSTEAAKRIYAFNPEAKILIFVRNPIESIYSLHAELYSAGLEPIRDILKAIEAESDRRSGKRMPRNHSNPRGLLYTEMVDYATQIRRFQQYFPDNQLKIVVYNDILNNIEYVFREILEFLEVDHSFKPEFRLYNARETKEWHRTRLKRWRQANAHWFDPVNDRIPGRLSRIMENAGSAILGRETPLPPPTPAEKARIAEMLSDKVHDLEKLLDRRL